MEREVDESGQQPAAVDAAGPTRATALTAPNAAEPPERRLAQVVRPIVWCEATDRIRDVARRISAGDYSCALVRTHVGLGIVTDHDFRHRVATGEIGVDAPVSALATVPVLTIEEDATQAAVLLRMVEHAVHHLVVTDSGGRPIGAVRAVDLAQARVRDPLLVRSAIDTAATLADVANAARLLPGAIVALCDSRTTATQIGAVHAAVVDAIVRRVLRLRADPVLAEVRHSWVVLGSLARRESLPLSDIDTALVWEDPPAGAPDPAESIRAAAGRIIDDLQRCGLVPCPNGTNADNPTFSRARSAWLAAIPAWRHESMGGRAVLMSAMIADSRPLTEVALGRCLGDPVHAQTRNTRFLRAMLDEALRFRPPTGFVRDFVVEHSGEHSGQLDLKKGGLAPVVALARWVGVAVGDVRGNTSERLRRGADRGLLTVDEAQTMAGAFEGIYGLVLRHEADALRAGATPTTFIDPGGLDTLHRRHLRESFRAVRSVQARIDEHWLVRLDTIS
jgi:CBS domain-containing protein